MQTMKLLYNILLLLVAVPGIPFFFLKMMITGKYRHSFIQKLGGRQKTILASLPESKRVWIHAVSVGEVTAAAPIVTFLKDQRPDVQIIFSTSTETGQSMAQRLVKGASAFIYFPLDIPYSVQKMLDLVRPDVFALVETELWPNFLDACRRRGVPSLMLNGRISPRSFPKYQKTSFFWRQVLQNVEEAGMIAEIDAKRLCAIGMDEKRIRIMGNAKYDALAAMASPALHADIAGRFNIGKDEKIFVAGSTHPGEEEVVIRVYQKLLTRYPDFKLVLVPRHIERKDEIAASLRAFGFEDIITVSQMNQGRRRLNEPIILVDVIGELFKVYSLATVVYCGGSLVPKGGQNILESAAWGKVTFYGPSMEDFSQEAALLEAAGAGIRIAHEQELLQGILKMLEHPSDALERGMRGQAVVRANMGAARRYAEMVIKHIG